MEFANKNGNIKKATRAIDVWNSIEEFLRLVLTPKPKAKKRGQKKKDSVE